MTPQEQERLRILEQVVQKLVASDRYTFQKDAQFFDGRNISTGSTIGTKIGTTSTQKIAFLGADPIAQLASSTHATVSGSAEDAIARNLCNEILDCLEGFGFKAAP